MPRPNRGQIRQLIRDYFQEYRLSGGELTYEAAYPAIRDAILADFSESPWLELILEILKILLPLLLLLFAKRDVPDEPVNL
jgi:hypothetical protein